MFSRDCHSGNTLPNGVAKLLLFFISCKCECSEKGHRISFLFYPICNMLIINMCWGEIT